MPDQPDTPQLTFDDLGFGDAVLKARRDVGYETTSPIQAATIPTLLEGRESSASPRPEPERPRPLRCRSSPGSTCPRRRPGAGAGADPRARAAGVRGVREYAAHLRGVHVLPVYGRQGYGVQLSALRRGVHIVVGTPGRIMDHLDKGTLDMTQLRFLVLDEADEMLDIGFAGRSRRSSRKPRGKNLLFSATMPARIRGISKKYLVDPVEITVREQEATAGKIRQRTSWSPPQKFERSPGSSRGELPGNDRVRPHQAWGRTVGKKLRAGGAPATASTETSGRRGASARPPVQVGQLDILVATDVVGRGIDVERISHVMNFDIPTDPELRPPDRPDRPGRTQRRRHLVRHPARAAPARSSEDCPPATHPDAAPDGRGRQRHPAGPLRRRDHRGTRGRGEGVVLPRRGGALRARAQRTGVDVAAALGRRTPGGRAAAARAGTKAPRFNVRGRAQQGPPTG